MGGLVEANFVTDQHAAIVIMEIEPGSLILLFIYERLDVACPILLHFIFSFSVPSLDSTFVNDRVMPLCQVVIKQIFFYQ